MYILGISDAFDKLMRQLFFNLDNIIFNFIPSIYNLLITIARTSPLSQGDIMAMADRIYKLLAIFMVFKVTFSLIMYVVNPDDFSDKNKGISKLGTNIVISLGLLILTPYVFNLAYQLQTTVLEDNSLATLVFGETSDNNFFNTAGDDIAFSILIPFYTPDISNEELYECINLFVDGKANERCTGVKNDDDFSNYGSSSIGLKKLVNKGTFTEDTLKNYVAGINNRHLGLAFRIDMVKATDEDGNFIMVYSYLFSTAVGIVVVLLLISFCMDVAVRSIKLAFLQLIAPIPIISYVDPKSGKDGMFKKWYQMCFNTFLSLFIRLLALYFAVYIISKVGKLYDVVDGSVQTNFFVTIFIIIGALMFAKQFPKILEGLGVKLDGGGFTLNPLKKFEKEALGGKQILGGAKGLAAGAMVGAAGALSGAGIGRIATSTFGGMKAGIKGKKFGEIRKDQVTKNAEMRRAIAAGSTLGGRLRAQSSSFLGTPGALGRIEHDKISSQNRIDELNAQKDKKNNEIVESRRKIASHKRMQDAISSMESRAKDEIEQGHGVQGAKYLSMKNKSELAQQLLNDHKKVGDLGDFQLYARDKDGKIQLDDNKRPRMLPKNTIERRRDDGSVELIKVDKNNNVSEELLTALQRDTYDYKGDIGMKDYMTEVITRAKESNGEDILDATFYKNFKDYESAVENVEGQKAVTTGGELHSQYGKSKGIVGDIQRDEILPAEDEIQKWDDEIKIEKEKQLYTNAEETKEKANYQSTHSTEGGPSAPKSIISSKTTMAPPTGGYGSGRPPFGGPGGMPPGSGM